jgi:hypothetical protein
MPFYSCILKATSLPENLYPDLEKLQSEEQNPHHLPLARLVSVLVRENSSRWLSDNISDDINLWSQHELEQCVMHCFALVLEMIVAAEVAKEPLHELLLIKFVLSRCRSLISLLLNETVEDKCTHYESYIWEIYGALSKVENDTTKQNNIKKPIVYIIWGQALLKLARTYFVPQGVTDIGKDEYFDCLKLAIEKFCNARQMITDVVTDCSDYVDAVAGIGYCTFLQGRATHEEITRRNLFLVAKEYFEDAEAVSPNCNTTYNLACLCSLLNQPEECYHWFDLCRKRRTLPPAEYLRTDPDLTPEIKQQPWFRNYLQSLSSSLEINTSKDNNKKQINPNTKVNNKNSRENERNGKKSDSISMSTKKRYYVFRDCIDMNYNFSPLKSRRSSPQRLRSERTNSPIKYNATNIGAQAILHQQSITIERFTDDDKINDLIRFDEDLNKLQGSLFREGFSVRTVKEIILEVWTGKRAHQLDSERIAQQRERLTLRLKTEGFFEKCEVPADGNCQMSAISDQLFDTVNKASYVRQKIVTWLRNNSTWSLPNGALMKDFVHDKTWEEYCAEMAREGTWGDHLTLVAASEVRRKW